MTLSNALGHKDLDAAAQTSSALYQARAQGLNHLLVLLAPLAPHVTSELWSRLPANGIITWTLECTCLDSPYASLMKPHMPFLNKDDSV